MLHTKRSSSAERSYVLQSGKGADQKELGKEGFDPAKFGIHGLQCTCMFSRNFCSSSSRCARQILPENWRLKKWEGSKQLCEGVFGLASTVLVTKSMDGLWHCFNSVAYANSWRAEKAQISYVNESSLTSTRQKSIKTGHWYCLWFYDVYANSLFSHVESDLQGTLFDHFMPTFAITIVFCTCLKRVISWFFLYSALFALYSCVVQIGMAPSSVWEV